MAITLSDETETRLRETAEMEGQDVNALADALLAAALEWEAQERAETLQGLRRGLEASDAGRVRPFADFAAEMRKKYALPAHLSDAEIGGEVIGFL